VEVAIMNRILSLHNQIHRLYEEYDALIHVTFPLGTVVKNDRTLGIIIKNEGRFGLNIIADNGHMDSIMSYDAIKVDIKNIPSNTRRRVIDFKKYGIRHFYNYTVNLDW
jgi:hypothetical protein